MDLFYGGFFDNVSQIRVEHHPILDYILDAVVNSIQSFINLLNKQNLLFL